MNDELSNYTPIVGDLHRDDCVISASFIDTLTCENTVSSGYVLASLSQDNGKLEYSTMPLSDSAGLSNFIDSRIDAKALLLDQLSGIFLSSDISAASTIPDISLKNIISVIYFLKDIVLTS